MKVNFCELLSDYEDRSWCGEGVMADVKTAQFSCMRY